MSGGTILEVVVLVLLGCAVTTTLAAIAIGPAEVHPKYEGKCWSSALGQAFSAGQYWQEAGACVRLSCGLSHRGSLVVQYSTCGSVSASPPCRVEKGDPSLHYPKCCYNIVCPAPEDDLLSSSSSSSSHSSSSSSSRSSSPCSDTPKDSSSDSSRDQKPTGIDHDALLMSPEEAEKDKEYEDFYNWIYEYYDYYDKPSAVV